MSLVLCLEPCYNPLSMMFNLYTNFQITIIFPFKLCLAKLYIFNPLIFILFSEKIFLFRALSIVLWFFFSISPYLLRLTFTICVVVVGDSWFVWFPISIVEMFPPWLYQGIYIDIPNTHLASQSLLVKALVHHSIYLFFSL